MSLMRRRRPQVDEGALVLSMVGVDAGYGQSTVLRNLDLEVRAGEVVSLIGPNGAGKTTTLLTISGLLAPTAGSIEVLGSSPPTRHPHRSSHTGVAHVPENRGVLHQLTVRENLGLSLDKQGLEVAFDLFPELVPLASRRAGLLSGGEQQMLALGRALASRPSLLLLDEMSLGLAPVIVDRLLPFARRAADEGAGVVLVEQHTDRALSISDRAYVLVHGEVALSGSARELMEKQHLLDAAFFGYTEE